jgi:hypothetical protein
LEITGVDSDVISTLTVQLKSLGFRQVISSGDIEVSPLRLIWISPALTFMVPRVGGFAVLLGSGFKNLD